MSNLPDGLHDDTYGAPWNDVDVEVDVEVVLTTTVIVTVPGPGKRINGDEINKYAIDIVKEEVSNLETYDIKEICIL